MATKTAIIWLACQSLLANAFVPASRLSRQNKDLFASASIGAPFKNRRKVSSSLDVRILEPIGNGTFGGVFWAEDALTGKQLVAKSARATTPDKRAQQNAKSYLEIESYINSKLCFQSPSEQDSIYQQHVAPYLGDVEINQTMYLIWESTGEYTLEDYIEIDNGWVQLAKDLGMEQNDDDRHAFQQRFAMEVLRQLLEGLAYCHSLGVIHRDIKPANVLMDPKSKTLRLIDFGSACDMSSWTTKAGYRGQNKGPRSILYCAPEEFVNEEHPYAFDVYGAAITWLRVVLAEDGPVGDADGTQQTSFGLGDEDKLFQWRLAVRDFGHNLVSWEEYAVLQNSVPYGWNSLFGSSRQGIHALRLLSSMLCYSPAQRITASEALLGPYLNAKCDAEVPPGLPPAMPWSIMSHVQRWKKEREVQFGECRLEDLFTEVIAVELKWPLGLSFEKQNNGGVKVSAITDGSLAAKVNVCEGDSLLAIGSIDVENVSLEHVNEILEQWPGDNPVPLLFVRDSE